MDAERWPRKICEIVDAMTCPRCDEPKRGPKGIFVRMRYLPPVWAILAECWQCGLEWNWQISPNSPEGAHLLDPLPVAVTPGDVIQPPGWWKELGQ